MKGIDTYALIAFCVALVIVISIPLFMSIFTPKGEKKMKKSEQIKRLESQIEELKERMDAKDFLEINKQGFEILIMPTYSIRLFPYVVKTTYKIQFVNKAKVRSVEVFDEEDTPGREGEVDVVEKTNKYFVVKYDRENEEPRYFYIDKNACTSTEITGAYTEKK